MATSADIFCGPCNAQNQTKCAEHWCPECVEGLCLDCQIYHSSSKTTKKHQIITIDSYKQIPTFVSEIEDTCQEHEMQFNMYCPHHDTVCCPLCVSIDHCKCTELRAISGITKHAKTSAFFSLIEERLQKVTSFTDFVLNKVTANKSKIKQQRIMILNEINQLRSKIKTHIDSLEKKIIHELNNADETVNAHLEIIKTQMGNEKEKCNEIRESLLGVKEYGSDIQSFYGGRKIKSEIEKMEKILKTLSENDGFREKQIENKVNNKISNIWILKKIGAITIKTGRSLGFFMAGSNILGQTLSVEYPSFRESIDDIRLSLYQRINRQWSITGCDVCPSGKLLLSDWYNNNIVIFTPNGSLDKEIKLPTSPNDITVVDETTVAVSARDGIQIIDINSGVIKQDISTNNRCHGISYHDDTLYWCQETDGIQKMQMSTGELSTLTQQSNTTPDVAYIAVHRGKIYKTKDNTVTCYTKFGQTEWEFEFKSDSSETESKRVTVDNDSIVHW